MDEVDYLVLGGGSAGCVLASRLSEDPGATVALIEAGGSGDGWVVDTPIAGVLMAPTKLNNWAYETVPQPGLGGRRGYQPRGRALGGSSAINAMIYTRGHPADYDRWAALGNPGWSYAETLPYFLKAENNEAFDDAYHGRGGPLNVADSRSDNPFHQRFLDAAREAQLPLNDDFNGARQEGLGLYQLTQINGERCSAARAYLRPHLGKRPNLRVETRARALRLLFDGKRAIGAEILQRGVRRVVAGAARDHRLARRLRLAATPHAVGRRRGGGAGRARDRAADRPAGRRRQSARPPRRRARLFFALARPARPVVRRARAARIGDRALSPRAARHGDDQFRRGGRLPQDAARTRRSPTSSSISSSRWSKTTRASCAGAAA